MESQPQMSLALPCRALWEGRWDTEVATAQLAQQAGGQSPGTPKWGALQMGQAKGDNYPKYSSVDKGKIFILLYSHQNSCLLIFKTGSGKGHTARSNVNKI